MVKDPIGERFKRYELTSDQLLVRRTPVICRVDGRAFHTLTRSCEKPFDERFADSMLVTAQALCKEIQGCKMGYWQSDEISLLICDYDKITTDAWFDYRLQKMCSIAASLASVTFSKRFERTGLFDARFFNVPESDVANYFLWRQKDAERNSLQMLAQSHFSPKQLHGKKAPDLHEMLHGIDRNWNDLPIWQKRGAAIVKEFEGGWDWDENTPVFSQERDYIESRLPS
jgi:tRNA(His) guanylyltransferase